MKKQPGRREGAGSQEEEPGLAQFFQRRHGIKPQLEGSRKGAKDSRTFHAGLSGEWAARLGVRFWGWSCLKALSKPRCVLWHKGVGASPVWGWAQVQGPPEQHMAPLTPPDPCKHLCKGNKTSEHQSIKCRHKSASH